MDTQTCYDWLFVFFVHQADGYVATWDAIINDIEKMGPGANSCIYLIQDSLKVETDLHQVGHQTNLFSLNVQNLDRDPATGKWKFLPVPVYIDNESRKCWKTAFEYIYRNVKAKRRVLACFSHGAAFGINLDTSPSRREEFKLKDLKTGDLILDTINKVNTIGEYPEIGKLNANLPAIAGQNTTVEVRTNADYILDNQDIAGIKNLLELSTIDKSSPEFIQMEKYVEDGRIPKDKIGSLCKALEILWISDLANALKLYLGDSRIDLLLLNNCYMQNFDTGFLLRNNVDYIVASEGWLNASGFDYPALLTRMQTDAALPGAELARGAVLDYIQFYKDRNMTDDLNQQAVFANDISLYPRALTLFNQLLDVLEANIKVIISDLVDIRENQVSYVSCPYSQYSNNYLCMVDALLWVELAICSLLKRVPNAFGCTPMLAQFRDMKAKIVVQSSVGQKYIDFDKDAVNKYGYSGLSIFYPTKADRATLKLTPWCAYFGKQVKGDWETKWMRFLNIYYNEQV